LTIDRIAMTEPDDSASWLAWQSAFWALIPLALNSMLQPAGRISEYNATISFFLRISPIICIVDAVSSVALIISYMAHDGVGFRIATRAWADLRFRPDEGESMSESASPSRQGEVETIEASPLVRLIVFIITVTQSVKLFACTGIPWTHAWAYMFLGSFVLLEVCLRVGYTLDNDTFRRNAPAELIERCSNPPRGWRTWMVIDFMLKRSASIQIVLTMGSLMLLVPVPFQFDLLAGWLQTILVLLPWYFPAFPWHFLTFIVNTPLILFYVISLPFGKANSVVSNLMFQWLRLISSGQWVERFWWLLMNLVLVSALVFLTTVCSNLRISDQTRRVLRFVVSLIFGPRPRQRVTDPHTAIQESLVSFSSDYQPYLVFWLPLLTFLATLLSYAMRYDPNGTFRPGWTDNLG
jgi:hypothetical protein